MIEANKIPALDLEAGMVGSTSHESVYGVACVVAGVVIGVVLGVVT